jgi:2-aminoadipate transaminase
MGIDVGRLQSALAAGGSTFYVDGRPGGPMPLVFEAGLPDPVTFPVDDLARLSATVLSRDRDDLQYGTPIGGDLSYGFFGLRERLAERTSTRDGVAVEPSGVMLTAGGGHGISLAMQAFVDPGDEVVVEAPTWEYPLRDISAAGAVTTAIPLDVDGMPLDALEERLAAGAPVKVVYTIATFNVPTGVCLSTERRRRLVDLAEEHDFLVVEDDTYGDLRYSGEALPTLLSLDAGRGRVVQIGSFSKVVMPGLRLGWVVGHPDVVNAMARVRRDLGVGQFVARLMGDFLAEGLLEPQIARTCELYRSKRDTVLAALERHCAGLMTWNRPDGGFFVWLELADGVDGRALQRNAMAHGVFCRPGERFYGEPDDASGQRMRLAFTAVPADQLERAAEVLAASV